MMPSKNRTFMGISSEKMRRLSGVGMVLALLLPVAIAGEAASDESFVGGEPVWNLVQAAEAVGGELLEIDRALLGASLALSETGIVGAEARRVLEELGGVGPWVVDCITIDLNGTILEVAPEEYRYVVGERIDDQEHIQELLATRRPAGLAYIISVEGIPAMDFASPVFDENGRLMGAVTVLVNATELFGEALAPHQPEGHAKIWAMLPDGTIVYDVDGEQIGRNTFIDPLFAEFTQLLAVARKVEVERSGTGKYEISGTAREVLWTTVDHQGREVRLLLSLDVDEARGDG